MEKNIINAASSEIRGDSLTEKIAALEENIRHKEAIIQATEHNIKLIMEQKSQVRCNQMAYASKLKFLSRYDSRIRQKRSHRAYMEDDLNRCRAELEKLKACLPVA